METIFYTHLDTPVGLLLVASSNQGLIRIILPGEGRKYLFSRLRKEYSKETLVENGEKNQEAVEQLKEYFNGSRESFSLRLDIRGTEFQKSVWKAVVQVPYGQTCSYGEIARRIGKPRACRAVGLANKTNSLPIVIPCHRIIGSDGSMTGYGGGIPLKEKLLKLEQNSS